MCNNTDTDTSFRRKTIKHLTTLAHVPTPFLSAFLAVHLSAPLVANFGGGELSSQVMLLGREYYQRSPTASALLVYTPLALHILSTSLKRLLLGPLRSPTLLTSSAYLTGLLLPTHIFVSRYAPTFTDAPILSLGPGELDYEFVKHGLKMWPGRASMVLFSGLVCAVCAHAMEGWRVVLRRWAGMGSIQTQDQDQDIPVITDSNERDTQILSQPASSSTPSTPKPTPAPILSRLLPALLPAALVLSGVLVLYIEEPQGSAVLPSMQTRFKAVYRRAWWWFW